MVDIVGDVQRAIGKHLGTGMAPRAMAIAAIEAVAPTLDGTEYKVSTNYLGETWLIARAEGHVDFQDCDRIELERPEPKEWR